MLTGHFGFENIVVIAISLVNLTIGIVLVRRPRQVARWLRQFGPDIDPRARALEKRHEGWITAAAGVIAILIAGVGTWVALWTDLTGTARF